MSIFATGKVLGHIDRIAKWKAGEVVYPVQIELGTTNVCNSACPFCCGYKDRIEHSDTLSAEVVLKLLDEAKECGVKSITFTGDGEPTCHPNWLDFIKYCHKIGLEVGLITNGIKDVTEAAEYCQWIRVSVDAATDATYEKMHGRKHFSQVLENLKKLTRHKRGCTVGVGFLTCKDSNHEILKFSALMGLFNVDYVQYRPLLSVFGSDWFSDTPDTVELIKIAQERNPKVQFSEAKYRGLFEGHYGQTEHCLGWIFEAAISADGGIYRCCHYKGIESQKLGDISKGFKAEWGRIIKKPFKVLPTCPKFCRHYSNNRPLEEVFKPREHPNFI